MKFSAFILLAFVSVFSMVACDSKRDEAPVENGVFEAGVSNSNIAGTWQNTVEGSQITILTNANFQDFGCDRQGIVFSHMEDRNCLKGFKCGSFNFSVAPYNSVNVCASPGQTACTYQIDTRVTPNTMKLSCRDRVDLIKFSYSRM